MNDFQIEDTDVGLQEYDTGVFIINVITDDYVNIPQDQWERIKFQIDSIFKDKK